MTGDERGEDGEVRSQEFVAQCRRFDPPSVAALLRGTGVAALPVLGRSGLAKRENKRNGKAAVRHSDWRTALHSFAGGVWFRAKVSRINQINAGTALQRHGWRV